MKDHLGRNIDYLRISLTDKCNLRCIYCMPEEGVDYIAHENILRLGEIADIVRVAAQKGIRSVRLTGGEPLVRKGIVSFVAEISQIPGIENISMTTNAILLEKYAADLKDAGLDRVNISLDTLDADQFRMITRRGKLEDALAGIEAAFAAGFDPIKINAVAVRRLNQDFLAFARLSVNRPLHVRFIEYMPVGESSGADGCGWDDTDVIPSAELFELINKQAAEQGIEGLVTADASDAPIGWGPARYYKFPGAQGTVGFISPLSNHFCKECNKLRLTADGKLRPCLFSDLEYDVRDAVRSGNLSNVESVFDLALGNKPDEHHNRIGTDRAMSAIGG